MDGGLFAGDLNIVCMMGGEGIASVALRKLQ